MNQYEMILRNKGIVAHRPSKTEFYIGEKHWKKKKQIPFTKFYRKYPEYAGSVHAAKNYSNGVEHIRNITRFETKMNNKDYATKFTDISSMSMENVFNCNYAEIVGNVHNHFLSHELTERIARAKSGVFTTEGLSPKEVLIFNGLNYAIGKACFPSDWGFRERIVKERAIVDEFITWSVQDLKYKSASRYRNAAKKIYKSRLSYDLNFTQDELQSFYAL